MIQNLLGRRRGTVGAAALALVLAVVGILALVAGTRGGDGPPQPLEVAQAAPTSSTPAPASSAASSSAADASGAKRISPNTGKAKAAESAAPGTAPRSRIGQFLPASVPTRLEIPSIGVRSANFVDLHVAADGTLEVPGSADEVGFYSGGPTPGQLGPAVLGAHVDSTRGPGVFYNLGAVKPGAKIHITREDKSKITFVVDDVAVHPKNRFPTEKVYRGSFTRSEIRLVTCGGPFDPVKHYLSNVVVFGHLADAG
ncbi:MAG TPA: class F sortase [Propionibacteriaceae bacterium]|nr:class F sortase [Propionibacteriaceae bacterium]